MAGVIACQDATTRQGGRGLDLVAVQDHVQAGRGGGMLPGQGTVFAADGVDAVVVAAEDDVTKNATGNAAAGVRARKTLRTLKQDVADLVKLTLGKDVD